MYQNLADPNLDFWPKLYVQNVLILEHSKEILPTYLRFISWVIETNDLPLNISREMLQNNSTLEKIKKSLTKKLLSELQKNLKEKRSDYEIFWKNYGKILKEWIYYDYDLKEEIASTSLFKSLNTNNLISLDEYLEKAPEKKSIEKHWDHEHEIISKNIYYIIAKSENEAKASPFISQFKEHNTDVLIFTDAIDSFWVNNLTEYKWAKFVSITTSDVELEEKTEEQKEAEKTQNENFKSLFDFIKNTIWEEKIEEVKLNKNLWENLWALKTPKNWIDPQLEKMMRAMWQEVPTQKRILELNPKNKLVEMMKTESEKDLKSEKLQDAIKYAYYQAILLEWWEIKNISEFVNLTNKFATKYLD